MYDTGRRPYGEARSLFVWSAGGESHRGAFAGRGGAGVQPGSRGSGSAAGGSSEVSIPVTRGSAFVRRHPNRDEVSATTPIDTAAPSTTNCTTEFRRLRPMPRSLARWSAAPNWPMGQNPNRGGRSLRGTRDGRSSGRRATVLVLDADVAQLVEHFTRNEGVPGSSPGVGSSSQPVAW